MASYVLSIDAEKDLQEVAQYTLHKWGAELFKLYREGLKNTFVALANNKIPKRAFSKTYPDLFVSKYRFHYIFYVLSRKKKIVIIGVIHEKRDIVNRLSERLG